MDGSKENPAAWAASLQSKRHACLLGQEMKHEDGHLVEHASRVFMQSAGAQAMQFLGGPDNLIKVKKA